jgi:outer membrane scaffolding protein for murein synthesis (MipA/OmpV family)
MSINYRVIVALLLLSFLSPGFAICKERPLWELGIGLGLLQMPDYRGSDENRLYWLPYPYVVYRGDIFKVEDQSISGQIFKTDRILLNFSFYGAAPVRSSHNSARSGMQDLDPTFELGPALTIKLRESKEDKYKLELFLPVRAFFSTNFHSVSHEGWIFSPRINFMKDDFIPDTGLNLGISAGPIFADSGYHDYFYTVAPAYSTAERPAYSAGGGYSGSTLTVGLDKSYKQFIFFAFVSADFLQGATFENSPLVKRETSFMSGISVSWIFFKSEKTVNVDK